MIYTVTFNPALDYVVHMDTFALGEVNRTSAEALYYGGKGINVSTVLTNLGVPNIALGFIAGFTGKAIEDGLRAQGIQTDFIQLKNGFSRINVKIKSGSETEINGQGPKIENADLEQLFIKTSLFRADDILVLAGSIPKTLPADIYEDLLARLEGKGIRYVVDATGDLLVNVLKYKPFLIKPNNKELGEIFGKSLETEEQLVLYAKKLQEMGARNVLVSRAKDGALLAAEDGHIYKMGNAPGRVRNSVGAGDSMVAGFLAGWLDTGLYDYALRLGSAAGNATAFSQGIAEKEEILNVLNILTNKQGGN